MTEQISLGDLWRVAPRLKFTSRKLDSTALKLNQTSENSKNFKIFKIPVFCVLFEFFDVESGLIWVKLICKIIFCVSHTLEFPNFEAKNCL